MIHRALASRVCSFTTFLLLSFGGNLLASLDFSQLTSADIGMPASKGSVSLRNGSLMMQAGGQGIGFRSDQFHFAFQNSTNDFDVRIRVVSLGNTDLWAKAGLMIRAGQDADAAFAAVFSTPSGAGSLFQSRDTAGATAQNQGFFPANHPFSWLRLKRAGDSITGFASYDGRRWTTLGSRAMTLGSGALLGCAATSHGTNVTTVEFREVGPADGDVTEPVRVDVEPLGPANRRSGIIVSEIMYNPLNREDGKTLEFVEIYNSQAFFEDIGGWRLTGEIEYEFPAGTFIPAGGFMVVAAVPKDLESVYGLTRVAGPYVGRLSNDGGRLRLVGDRHDATYFDVEYGTRSPWPRSADGAGHSLVLVRPSFSEGNPAAWGASRLKGGSPGAMEAVEISPSLGVRINECRSGDGTGFVELFNSGSEEADLGGMRLGTSVSSMSFVIDAGKKLAPGAVVHFTAAQLGFVMNPAGFNLYLEASDASRMIDVVVAGPQWGTSSTGRYPNGHPRWRTLSDATPGVANARPQSPVVFNELHFAPMSGNSADEFIELHNRSEAPLDIGGWELTSGVEYTFPTGSRIEANGFLVVAKRSAGLRQRHPQMPDSWVVGDYTGQLSGRGETIVLSRPVVVRDSSTGRNRTVLAEVTSAAFNDGGRGSMWADQGGSTLELTDHRSDTTLPASWFDSDESAGGRWTTLEVRGALDNTPTTGGGGGPGGGGGGAAGTTDSLQIQLMGEGECLIDNVEVIGPGNTNRIANGTFEQGTTGWIFAGNHIRTTLETTEGDASQRSLHIRASNNGDPGANKVYYRFPGTLRTNDVVTLRARVRWLKGWPEVLLRLRGNYLEAYGRMDVPVDPGTPGAQNSRFATNAGPAISDVSHFPVVPEADQSILITARVDDPDGLKLVNLHHRTDSEAGVAVAEMRDDGTSGDAVPGDGIFSARLPGGGRGQTTAFWIEASDGAASPVVSRFPPGGSNRECLVRFGDETESGAFGTYRLWMTRANTTAWQNRAVLSNEPVDGTFVYGNWRAVYNAGGRFAGSPYHQNFSGPTGDCHYVIEFPKDDRVLGASALNKIHAPGNGPFDDNTIQREQAVYWLARKMGMPWFHRRYVHVFVNGVQRRTLMEDTQVGSNDSVEQFWPDDPNGHLFKMQPWFEFTDGTNRNLGFQNSSWCYIREMNERDGQPKVRRYRWNWLTRAADGTANDYSSVFALVDAASDFTNPDFAANVENLVDVDEWFRFFAINHAAGNWDSVGYRNCQNTYGYKPRNGRWELILWDANIVFGNSGSDQAGSLPLFTTSDPTLTRWFAPGSVFRRRFLTAYHDLVMGPMQTNQLSPILDAKYAAFQEHGVVAASPTPIKTYVSAARTYILSQINRESAAFAVTNIDAGSKIISGLGPLAMASLLIDGVPVTVRWTSSSAWTAVLPPGVDSQLEVVALNASGEPIANGRQVVVVEPPGRLAATRDGFELLLVHSSQRGGRYELQFNGALSGGSWLSVTNQTVDRGPVRFRIPLPSQGTRFFRVLEP